MNDEYVVQNRKGLSILEVILVGALLALIIGSLVQLGILGIRTADMGRSRTVAAELSEEAIEVARAMRDEHSTEFFTLIEGSATEYYSLENNAFSSHPGATEPTPPDLDLYEAEGNDGYYRIIHFELDGSGNVLMWVKTYWEARGVYQHAVLETILTRWR